MELRAVAEVLGSAEVAEVVVRCQHTGGHDDDRDNDGDFRRLLMSSGRKRVHDAH